MLKMMWWTLVLLAILTFTNGQNPKISEEEMQKLLAEYDTSASELAHRVTEASWNVATDVGNQAKVNEKVRKVSLQ